MKKMLMFLLLLNFELLKAPSYPVVYIGVSPVIYHDPMLRAFMKVESNFNHTVINSLGYGGILQIGSEMIAEVNRICELRGYADRFVLDDRLDSAKSVRVWYIVQSHHNPGYDLRRAAKVWNPLASKNYLTKIINEL